MSLTAGYDVGGAHLKVALTENGRTIAVRQIPCPLWQGLHHLDAAFADAADLISRAGDHAATMTGELCELFPDRRTGVVQIVDRLDSLLSGNVRIWMGQRGLGSLDEARADPVSVASTNFLASAALVASRLDEALLVDMGSTTTDIVPIRSGSVVARGLTDGDRLASSELVYTGTTRTDVSTVAQRGVLAGRTQRLGAGGFANMADVRRVLGELPEGVDQHATLDGRGKSLDESTVRFARCFGRDASDAVFDQWRTAARDIANQQMLEIRSAIEEVLTATRLPSSAPIVAAGIGADFVEDLGQALGRPSLRFGVIAAATDDCRDWATRCAPAVAVALLAAWTSYR